MTTKQSSAVNATPLSLRGAEAAREPKQERRSNPDPPNSNKGKDQRKTKESLNNPATNLPAASGTVTTAATTSLVIQSTSSGTGSLICGGTPNATVKRYVDKNAWHQVAPITTPSTANDFYIDAGNSAWLTSHSESTNGWTYITDLGTTLNRKQGYMYWIDNAASANTVNFTGTIVGSDQSTSLTKDGSGWNLLGNPFTSAIDWDQGTWGSNSTGTVYVWDYSYNSGDYRTWNGFIGDLTGGIIPIGQGFFVQATSAGSFDIPAASRLVSSQAFYKSPDVLQTQYIRIQLDGNNYGNTVFIGFPENGTDGFDYYGDATKLYSSVEAPQLFAVENNIELCINANAPLGEKSKVVPLHLVQVIDGDYTITIYDLDQLPNTSISLEDLKTGASQDVLQNPVYSFSASSGDNPDRFLLHFKSTTYGIDDPGSHNESNVNIYASGRRIFIRSNGEAISQGGTLQLFDLSGRQLSDYQIEKGELVSISVDFQDTYVIARVIKLSEVKTVKIFIYE